MAYHINAEGDVALCKAQIRCPFGDFDTQHYVTKEEARAAFEAAMEGKTMDATYTKELKRKHEVSKKVAELQKRIPPLTYALPEVHRGYFLELSEVDRLMRGDPWPGGGVVDDTHYVRQREAKAYFVTFPNGRTQRYEFPLKNQWELKDEKVWVDEDNPEDIVNRFVATRERNMAVAVEALLPSKREPRFFRGPDTLVYHDDGEQKRLRYRPRDKMGAWTRKYRQLLQDAEASGVANPHSFALVRLKKALPEERYAYSSLMAEYDEFGDQRVVRILENVLTQNDKFELDAADGAIVADAFPEGQRPWLDYTFKGLGSKVE